jgi:hypothetical protein
MTVAFSHNFLPIVTKRGMSCVAISHNILIKPVVIGFVWHLATKRARRLGCINNNFSTLWRVAISHYTVTFS